MKMEKIKRLVNALYDEINAMPDENEEMEGMEDLEMDEMDEGEEMVSKPKRKGLFSGLRK